MGIPVLLPTASPSTLLCPAPSTAALGVTRPRDPPGAERSHSCCGWASRAAPPRVRESVVQGRSKQGGLQGGFLSWHCHLEKHPAHVHLGVRFFTSMVQERRTHCCQVFSLEAHAPASSKGSDTACTKNKIHNSEKLLCLFTRAGTVRKPFTAPNASETPLTGIFWDLDPQKQTSPIRALPLTGWRRTGLAWEM